MRLLPTALRSKIAGYREDAIQLHHSFRDASPALAERFARKIKG
jgi:hypothetical protein